MEMPKILYVILDRDDEGNEYPVAHATIDEIFNPNNEIIGIYELKKMMLFRKGKKE